MSCMDIVALWAVQLFFPSCLYDKSSKCLAMGDRCEGEGTRKTYDRNRIQLFYFRL